MESQTALPFGAQYIMHAIRYGKVREGDAGGWMDGGRNF